MAEKGEYVVDSSIVTKWFVAEKDSISALHLRNEFATGRVKLSAPTLLFYEVLNAIRFSGVFGEEDLAQVSKSLSRYQFEVWRPGGRLLELTAHLSVTGDVTVYDACYVALAQRTSSKLITEDQELVEKFPKLTVSLAQWAEQ